MTVTTTPTGDMAENTGGRKPWLLIGGGVAAAALLGGGAFAAMNVLGGGGDRPDAVLPATAIGYAQVDMDPGVGEKIAAVRFFRGLDSETKERLDSGEWRQWMFEEIQKEAGEDGSIASADYETDIEPWLGDRAGIALLPPAAEGEEPGVAIAVQVKDEDAATAFWDEYGGSEMGHYVDGDFVVLAPSEQVDDVRAAAEEGTLADDETYSSDMDDLGDAGLVTFWGDLADMGELATAVNPTDELVQSGFDDTDPFMGSSDDLDSTMDMASGRMAATVRLDEDMIEIHGITRGVEGASGVTDQPTPLVTELPADTAIAIAVENGADNAASAWQYYSEQNPEQVEQLTSEASMNGFNLPDDLSALLGDSMVLSVGPGIVDALNSISGTDTSVPAVPVAYRVMSDDTDRVQALMNENGLNAAQGILSRTDDNTMTIGIDQAYIDGLADGGGDTLGDSDLFQRAVDDAGDAHAVFYIDVAPFEELYLPMVEDADVRASLEEFGALGISGTTESETDGRFTMRLVTKSE